MGPTIMTTDTHNSHEIKFLRNTEQSEIQTPVPLSQTTTRFPWLSIIPTPLLADQNPNKNTLQFMARPPVQLKPGSGAPPNGTMCPYT